MDINIAYTYHPTRSSLELSAMSKLIEKTTIYKSRASWQRLDVLAVIGIYINNLFYIDPILYIGFY